MQTNTTIAAHVDGAVQRAARRLLKPLARPARIVHMGYSLLRVRGVPEYANPTDTELDSIERDLAGLGAEVEPLTLDPERFAQFSTSLPFPAGYHGGEAGGVWDEKRLEHFIAFERLGLADFSADDVYLDVAACESPWVSMLRDRLGVQAYAIDLAIGRDYRHLPYYIEGDATATAFGDGRVRGASLQCAFEMFTADSDVRLIRELGRVLTRGGRCIVSPLYMHTHYCGYSTAEYFGRGFADPDAIAYVRRGFRGIPFSRKYDAAALKTRILDEIVASGMRYRLLALRNKHELGRGVYCHFVLEILK